MPLILQLHVVPHQREALGWRFGPVACSSKHWRRVGRIS